MKGEKEPRVALLCQTILKINGIIGSNAAAFEALGEEEDLAKKLTVREGNNDLGQRVLSDILGLGKLKTGRHT